MDSGAQPSSDAGGSADAGAPTDAAFVEAPHLALPLLRYEGAGVLTTPKVVTVTFADDPFPHDLEAFGQSITATHWWDAVRAGYCESSGTPCIGTGAPGVSVEIATPAAANYVDSSDAGDAGDAGEAGTGVDLQAFIAHAIDSGTFPAPDANTVYVLYFPQTSTVTSFGTSCVDFDGYHSFVSYHGHPVAYAVVPECAAPKSSGFSLLQYTTSVGSHEIIEAATDPYPSSMTGGYYLDLDDPNTTGWNDMFGGEVADLCVDFSGAGFDTVMDGTFAVQRSWSNAQAAAGHDPCVPLLHPTDTYFNAAPENAMLVIADVGQSVSVDVDAFSDASMKDWVLTAEDAGDPNKPLLTFSISGDSPEPGGGVRVNNGSKAKVTVTLANDPGVQGALFTLVSRLGPADKPTAVHTWPVSVASAKALADGGDEAGAHRVVRRATHGANVKRHHARSNARYVRSQ